MLCSKPFASLALLLICALPPLAQAEVAKTTAAVELANKAETLKPGEWVWAPEIAPAGPVTVYVDLSRQLATVYRNGVRIGVSTISSGMQGYETPTGVFVILQKDANHHSNEYNNAPMRYQERLTWGGVALHAGGLPGYPESHGCVHLPLEFARLLFGITPMGGTVIIAGQAGGPLLTDGAGVLTSTSPKGADASAPPLAADETSRWTPERSPNGPVTLIVSRADQRAVVLRNGVEIGRSRVTLPQQDFQTHVLTLTRDADGQKQWILVGVPGHKEEGGKPVDASVLAQAKFPEPFLQQLRSVEQPGMTVLVTQAQNNQQTSGNQLTVLDSASEPAKP